MKQIIILITILFPLAINAQTDKKDVKNATVKYYNPDGQEISQPFQENVYRHKEFKSDMNMANDTKVIGNNNTASEKPLDKDILQKPVAIPTGEPKQEILKKEKVD